MSAFDQSIRSFLTAAASDSPTPGGGSVAALVAALGASMTSMVANLTQGAKFAEVEAEMQDAAAQMKDLILKAETMLEQDMASFDRYMSALKLPKETDEQKAARSAALKEATVQATIVPRDLARACHDVLVLSLQIAEKANKNVISDLGIAALLAEAAGQSAILTMDINLPGIKHAETKDAFVQDREFLLADNARLKDEIVAVVRRRLA
jgi:methenyltetrahydrofolate cyclohydrolase